VQFHRRSPTIDKSGYQEYGATLERRAFAGIAGESFQEPGPMTSPHNGAHGAVHLLTDSDALTASVRRTVRLEAAPDGKSLFLIDVARGAL
jgi:hypothetical protein